MKMKKLITLLLALAMVLSLAACGSKDTPAPDGQNTPAATYKIKLGTTGNEEHQVYHRRKLLQGEGRGADQRRCDRGDLSQLSAWQRA